ncbi:MAG TPA: tetratricopeptide repeat protein, partial [Thermodesulfovibrionia bacterium]|nr:tetratricopeptide repeat protein [Thermodesulfovibrionia bacterium]
MKKRYLFFSVFPAFLFVFLLTGCFLSANKDDLKQSRYLKEIGQSYLIENKLQNALVEFQKAMELNPRDKELHYYLGF